MKDKHVSALVIVIVLLVFIGGAIQQTAAQRCDYNTNTNTESTVIETTPSITPAISTSEGSSQ